MVARTSALAKLELTLITRTSTHMYSPDRPVIPHRVRMEAIAMREMEATFVSASMATEESIVK